MNIIVAVMSIVAVMMSNPLYAQEPQGLPDPPLWQRDPDNPNRSLPNPSSVQPEAFIPPSDRPADPHLRHADAFIPQVRTVGPGTLASALGANNGDTIILKPGVYKECGTWVGSHITIKAEVPGTAVFDGVTCAGKAIFIVRGHNITIDGLVFRNAAVRDKNGAGIRGEGRGLIVRNSQFLNNENGILFSQNTGGDVVIEDSVFDGNGQCDPVCAHGIYINQVDRLVVRRSTFLNTHVGHHIKSRAHETHIEHNRIDDSVRGNSSYLIDIPNGGTLVVRDNMLIKGPHTDNKTAFIAYGLEGIHNRAPPARIERNHFINKLPQATALFVRAAQAPAPILLSNTTVGKISTAVAVQ